MVVWTYNPARRVCKSQSLLHAIKLSLFRLSCFCGYVQLWKCVLWNQTDFTCTPSESLSVRVCGHEWVHVYFLWFLVFLLFKLVTEMVIFMGRVCKWQTRVIYLKWQLLLLQHLPYAGVYLRTSGNLAHCTHRQGGGEPNPPLPSKQLDLCRVVGIG